MSNAVIVITAKAPAPGRVKTRLAPLLSDVQRVALHTAFVGDTVRLARAVPGAEVVMLCPSGDAAALSAILSEPAVAVVEQAGIGLEAALEDVFLRFTAGGHRVVALDSDSPHLPAAAIGLALEALLHVDLVAGPTTDGGYYLVGGRKPHPLLFRAAPLGTTDALTQLVDRARELGLSTWLGPEEFDVDRPDDLHRLGRLLHREPWRAPATAALLSRVWPDRAT